MCYPLHIVSSRSGWTTPGSRWIGTATVSVCMSHRLRCAAIHRTYCTCQSIISGLHMRRQAVYAPAFVSRPTMLAHIVEGSDCVPYYGVTIGRLACSRSITLWVEVSFLG